MSPANGQGTGQPFPNPGSSGGLRGRKRDLTEGGIGVPGLIEWPAGINANRHVGAAAFAAGTEDILPTIADLLGVNVSRAAAAAAGANPDTFTYALDGESLVPFLSGAVTARRSGIGHYGVFEFGSTRHTAQGAEPPSMTGNATAFSCPGVILAPHAPNPPSGFSGVTPGNQPQLSWSEAGSAYKLFGCREKGGAQARSGACAATGGCWHFFLFDMDNPNGHGRLEREQDDVWAAQPAVAARLTAQFLAWQDEVLAEQAAGSCEDGPPAPTPRYVTVAPNMTSAMARCAANVPLGNKVGDGATQSADECALRCATATTANDVCGAFSFSPSCGCCWLFHGCNVAVADRSSTWVYDDWTSYRLI